MFKVQSVLDDNKDRCLTKPNDSTPSGKSELAHGCPLRINLIHQDWKTRWNGPFNPDGVIRSTVDSIVQERWKGFWPGLRFGAGISLPHVPVSSTSTSWRSMNQSVGGSLTMPSFPDLSRYRHGIVGDLCA